jgi:hypothetical protein
LIGVVARKITAGAGICALSMMGAPKRQQASASKRALSFMQSIYLEGNRDCYRATITYSNADRSCANRSAFKVSSDIYI